MCRRVTYFSIKDISIEKYMLTLNKRLFAKNLCVQKPAVERLTEERFIFLFIYFFRLNHL